MIFGQIIENNNSPGNDFFEIKTYQNMIFKEKYF